MRGSADLTGTVPDAGTPSTAVPEPATMLLLTSVFVTAAVAARRKRTVTSMAGAPHSQGTRL